MYMIGSRNESQRMPGMTDLYRITNLERNVEEILIINQRHWEIEENFQIMKSAFEARPVYVQRYDLVKSHFLTYK